MAQRLAEETNAPYTFEREEGGDNTPDDPYDTNAPPADDLGDPGPAGDG